MNINLHLNKEKVIKRCNICNKNYSVREEHCKKCGALLINEYVTSAINIYPMIIVMVSVVILFSVGYFIGSDINTDTKSWEDNIIMADRINWKDKNGKVLGGNIQRSDIASVTFLDSTKNLPDNSWDVSVEKNGSVMAYVEKNGKLYDLYITGDGGINSGEACQDLFCNYTNLKKINFNRCYHTDNATSFQYMFLYCEKLESIDFSGFNTSKVTNMEYMFFGCNSLKKLNISSFDTSSVTNMEGMFGSCGSLKKLNISSFDTSNVVNMSLMFKNCIKLKELYWEDFDTSLVTTMKAMFAGCASLEGFDLNSFNTSKVVDMQEMFSGCKKIEELDLSSFDTSLVENMQDMFIECTFLEKLDISHFNTSSVTNMQNMFCNCTSLEELDISGFDTSEVTIMRNMFYGCSSLKELDVSNFNISKVSNMSAMFYKCSSITKLDVSGFDTSLIEKPEYLNWIFAECKNLNSFGGKLLLPASQINKNKTIFKGTMWENKKWGN